MGDGFEWHDEDDRNREIEDDPDKGKDQAKDDRPQVRGDCPPERVLGVLQVPVRCAGSPKVLVSCVRQRPSYRGTPRQLISNVAMFSDDHG